jgi:hypothetical protein
MDQILHTIKAQLYDNKLTADDTNDFIARVSSEHALDLDEICLSAYNRGGADLPVDVLRYAAGTVLKEMSFLLCDGYAVNTGYFAGSPHIRGVFTSPGDRFDPARHTLLVEFHQGSLLREELQQVKVEILGVADAGPRLDQVIDVKTGSVNDVITPGRNLRILGHKIKIAGENALNGVTFTWANGSTSLKVPKEDIVINAASEIMIVVPPTLTAQKYQLKVTTQYSGANLVKVPRTVIFDKPLTVK